MDRVSESRLHYSGSDVDARECTFDPTLEDLPLARLDPDGRSSTWGWSGRRRTSESPVPQRDTGARRGTRLGRFVLTPSTRRGRSRSSGAWPRWRWRRWPRAQSRRRANAMSRVRATSLGVPRRPSRLPGLGPGRGQDLPDARRGLAAARARRRRRRGVRRDPRPGPHRRPDARPRGHRRARREYRGPQIEEMDLDAILARAPRSRSSTSWPTPTRPARKHEKRWQDVEQILDAGIDVITTVNIQHLESVNDVVEKITGIVQRETVPDAVVRKRRADRDRRHHPRGAAPAHGPRQHLQGREDRRVAVELLPRRATCRRCASSRCCGSPTGSRTRCAST